MENKKVIFSGIQPSGNLTIGNYFGSLKNWVTLQDEYENYFCVVDLHAITIRQDPVDLRNRTLLNLALYLAAGIDPKKSTLFIQSHVSTHSEAAWMLGCFTYMGELSRMTQFKDKSKKQGENISSGLLTYPILMAADILLYGTDLVPVGVDQKQHIELTRDIAIRFNNLYGDTFKIPDPFIPKVGTKIMDLQFPNKKMSKSESSNGTVFILDEPNVIRNKFKRAVTDDLRKINYDDEQPGIKNLIDILSVLHKKTPEEIIKNYEGKGYKELKEDVADGVINELTPIQNEVKRLLKDKSYLFEVYSKGAEKAYHTSIKFLRKMQKKVGFISR